MWQNFSPERREQISQNMVSAQSKYINSLDEEEMKKYKEHQSNSAKKLWNNLSEDKLIEYKEKISTASKEMWANKSEEERREIAKKIAAGRQSYWDNMSEEDRIAFGEQHKKWWDSLVGEEREKQMEPMRKGYLQWYHNLSKEEKDRLAKIKSECSQRYWDGMSDKDKEAWIKCHYDGISKYYNELGPNLNMNESSFVNYLNLNSLRYSTQYSNKEKHPDFDKLFRDKVSKNISAYHHWDFLIFTDECNVLVDIDGSVHDPKNKTTGTTEFNDSKRPYQTDSLPAYIVQCYDDNMTLNTPVVDVNGKNKMTLEAFLALVKWKNKSNKEKNEMIKNI